MAPPESTAPRDFRYFTPEPTVVSEAQQPSPPRAQPRLKLRRNASHAAGPTQSFLASVATVDVAIPSIEFPDSTEDCEMVDVGSSDVDTALLSPKRVASPPKTPMPTQSHGDMYRRTDWYAATPRSPDRPSSSYSNPSNCSDDSYFSGNNTMRSNGTMCTSPESDIGDPFVATPHKKHAKHATVTDEVDEPTASPQAQARTQAQAQAQAQARSKKYPDVPWTKDQSDHLLRTYHLYLQDPTVTPFRMERNSIPPEGIVYRVSKEAKRSWKGPKPKKSKLDNGKDIQQRPTNLTVEAALLMKPISGGIDFANSRGRSMSPAGDAPMPYIKWPHSGAATRSHLRDMCRNNYDQSAQMYMYLQTRCMTPFTQQRAAYTYVPVGYIPVYAAFSTKDVALSLATSTSESMQPDGPLAGLSLNSPPAVPEIKVMNETNVRDYGLNTSNTLPKRLGSPFSAKTYGPQTSKPLHSTGSGVSKSLNSTLRPSQSTITARKPLRSPLQLDDFRPLTGTQKRRAQHDLEYEMNASGAVTRPTILDNKVFGTPSDRRVRNRGHTIGDAGSRQRNYACFAPQSINFASPENDVFGATHRGTQSAGQTLSRGHGLPKLGLLPPPVFKMPGRPVPEHSTFPGRVSSSCEDPFQSQAHEMNMGTVRHRPYHTTQATQHQTRHSIESFDFTQGPAMRSRLAQMDQRLNEFNQNQKPRGGAGGL